MHEPRFSSSGLPSLSRAGIGSVLLPPGRWCQCLWARERSHTNLSPHMLPSSSILLRPQIPQKPGEAPRCLQCAGAPPWTFSLQQVTHLIIQPFSSPLPPSPLRTHFRPSFSLPNENHRQDVPQQSIGSGKEMQLHTLLLKKKKKKLFKRQARTQTTDF